MIIRSTYDLVDRALRANSNGWKIDFFDGQASGGDTGQDRSALPMEIGLDGQAQSKG